MDIHIRHTILMENLKFAVNINRDDTTDVFNGIVMGNEKLQLIMEFLLHLMQEKV